MISYLFLKSQTIVAVPMHMRKPIFSLNDIGDIINVRWAPTFEGPLMLGSDKMPAYYNAYLKFFNFLNLCKKEYGFTFKLAHDEAVLFNNRRMLHGRTRFLGKQRHLQGTYISANDFKSKLFTLANMLKEEVGNFNFGDGTF